MNKLIIEMLLVQLQNTKSLKGQKHVKECLNVFGIEVDNLKIVLDFIGFPNEEELSKNLPPHFYRGYIYSEFEEMLNYSNPQLNKKITKQNIDSFIKSICDTTKNYYEETNQKINKNLIKLLNHYGIQYNDYIEKEEEIDYEKLLMDVEFSNED